LTRARATRTLCARRTTRARDGQIVIIASGAARCGIAGPAATPERQQGGKFEDFRNRIVIGRPAEGIVARITRTTGIIRINNRKI
jgi:hypothetical protein